MSTIATVRRLAPEFASVSDDGVQAFLDDTAAKISPQVWGRLYDKVRGLHPAQR